MKYIGVVLGRVYLYPHVDDQDGSFRDECEHIIIILNGTVLSVIQVKLAQLIYPQKFN